MGIRAILLRARTRACAWAAVWAVLLSMVQTAPANVRLNLGDLPPENRVGVFSETFENGAGPLVAFVQYPRLENEPILAMTASGRLFWLSRDPLGEQADPLHNLYRFVGNNPLNAVDPLGLLNQTFNKSGFIWDWIVPDPVSTYKFGSEQADVLFSPDSSGFERTFAGLGVFSASILTVTDVIPGKSGVQRLLRREGMREAERLATRVTANVVEQASESASKCSRSAAKSTTWNEFQAATKGQVATRAEAGQAWQAYKEANGIVTGTTRSPAASAEYLKSLADDYRTPSWMKQWLQEGRRPPGYEVDHIKPLSVGGEDLPSNMRLQGADLHDIHHTYYRPWE